MGFRTIILRNDYCFLPHFCDSLSLLIAARPHRGFIGVKHLSKCNLCFSYRKHEFAVRLQMTLPRMPL